MAIHLHVNRGYEFNKEVLYAGKEREWLRSVGDKLAEMNSAVKVGQGDAALTIADADSLVALYNDAVGDMTGTAQRLGLSGSAALVDWFRDLAQTLDDMVKGTSEARGQTLDLTHQSETAKALGLDKSWRSYATSSTPYGQAPGTMRLTDVILSEKATRRVNPEDGAVVIPDRATFESLAHTDDVPGSAGVREVKFLVDIESGEVTFMNHNKHDFHYYFAKEALGYTGSLREFNAETYFTDNRKYMAGTLIAHDNFEGEGIGDGEKGLYTLEFWPTDPVKAQHVATAMNLVKDALPFASNDIVYHPAGETQRALYEQDKAAFDAAGVDTISTQELFANQTFSALNPGVGFGRLRVIDGSDTVPPTARDLVIFKNIPNDLSRVGGVITAEPQTPLSHVNLKAKQNDTPNAYVKDVLSDPEVQALVGKMVRFEVTGDGYQIREATAQEVEDHFASIRPTEVQTPARNLAVKNITKLADVGTRDLTTFGAKAANLGELADILPPGMVPDGYAVPFSMYDDFMKANGLYDEAQAMMQDATFQSDPVQREKMLKAFRKKIEKAPVPDALAQKFAAVHADLKATYGDEQPFRCRSSTNNEDLEGFNGAGLYESKTHRPDEGDLENTIKEVWAGLWTFRAFEEREFWRIDHMTAAMGVAIHPNFDLERSNGVAVTKNIYDPNWEGFYVNVQVGEDLVTNPEGGAVPEEFLISAIGPNREWETQFIRRSNLTENGETVMSDEHMTQLREAMRKIQSHFKQVYRQQGNDSFAMDIEFKVDAQGKLVIKQARPWVD